MHLRRTLRPRTVPPVKPVKRKDAAPGDTNPKAPVELSFEAQSHGISARCLRFAGWVTPPPRKTRFRLLASSTGWDWLPTGLR